MLCVVTSPTSPESSSSAPSTHCTRVTKAVKVLRSEPGKWHRREECAGRNKQRTRLSSKVGCAGGGMGA